MPANTAPFTGWVANIGDTAALPATSTLTSNNTNVTTAKIVTIGSMVYTFRTSLTTPATPNEVLIGADADASLLNLIRAINGTGTVGTDYSTGTPVHPQVTADAAVTAAHTFEITAKTKGAVGNGIVTTTNEATLSWTSNVMTGGDIGPYGGYETILASQTAQVLGPTGAKGDIIQRLIIVPGTTGPGVVTILDGTVSIPVMVTGGTTTLVPIVVELGIRSRVGAWKVTTGANVSVIAIGSFT